MSAPVIDFMSRPKGPTQYGVEARLRRFFPKIDVEVESYQQRINYGLVMVFVRLRWRDLPRAWRLKKAIERVLAPIQPVGVMYNVTFIYPWSRT